MAAPHLYIICVYHGENWHDLWECIDCGTQGTLDELGTGGCSFIPDPCSSCGQTPLCAPDCSGIVAALSDPDVYVTGEYDITR